MKNRITIAAVFTACLALCAAVWPQAETVGGTPAPPQSPAVSAPDAKKNSKQHHRQRKKKLRVCSRSLPMKPPMSRSLHQWKHP